MTRMHVEIAGGGFAGLVAAIAFSQRGWSARVHEAAPTLRGSGAGIFLAPNGQRVLKMIGAYDQALAHSYAAQYRESRDEDNNAIDLRPNEVPGGGQTITLSRRDLHTAIEAVARQCGVSIITDSPVVGADPSGILFTEDGRHWPADLVVGADGVGSRVRESLDDIGIESRRFPVGMHRFLVPRDWAGPREGQWLNYVNYWHLGLKRRALYAPCNDRDIYLSIGAEMADHAAHNNPLSTKVWSETFPALAGVFRELPALSPIDQYQVLRLSRWSSGRVAVVGDAAHVMPPTMGQGACSAMMNAHGLAVALQGGDDIELSLRKWESAQRPAIELAQTTSVEIASDLFTRRRVA